MSKTELQAKEARIRADDISESNREQGTMKAISRLMLSGMKLADAEREFNDQVAYFMRGIDGYCKNTAIDNAINVILHGDETSENHQAMQGFMYD